MRDTTILDTGSSPWSVAPSRDLDPASIVGWYAVDRAPLLSPAYRVVRIDRAVRVNGSLRIWGTVVVVDGNGSIVSESNKGENIPFIPAAFVANPLTAKVRADAANSATGAHEIRIHNILTGAL